MLRRREMKEGELGGGNPASHPSLPVPKSVPFSMAILRSSASAFHFLALLTKPRAYAVMANVYASCMSLDIA